MSKILLIESATEVCSVTLADNGKVIEKIENTIGRTHATHLAVYIDQVLKKRNVSVNNLSAIALSKGPGSYTGLRIGTSLAKGLCFTNNLPLIAIPTLEIMANGFAVSKRLENNAILCPMIDARRMEVYTALFNSKLELQKETTAEILDGDSFKNILSKRKVYFFGDGASKVNEVISHQNSIVHSDYIISSEHMISLAFKRLEAKQFEDLAYFEPFYLKDFIATTPKQKIPGL
ncbi:MAG: tRNA (adenosine(37)-N6)-threonylcarbamoyltransferase complex dimerization subunit type 1 TsaB [Desulfobacterales bacterium]|nr:tRNA (adenosine(37)-N6)-threonylcarbamoyltransferase complex dimerization subunit type 1 TsaB [Desulfobacterales bacterium]